jgi:WD40 repeat protein
MTDIEPGVEWRIDLEDFVSILETAPSLEQAITGSLGGDVLLVDTSDGSTFPLNRHEMGALSAAWSNNGSYVASGGQDGHVHIYNSEGIHTGTIEMTEWINALAWSPEESVLAIGSGKRLTIVNTTGEVLFDFQDQPSTITAIAWSIDGSRVGISAYGGIGWHDVSGPRSGRRKRFDWKGSLLALKVSPDGKWACAGAQDSEVHLWKLWSGKDLSMRGYPSKIEKIAFSDDSRWLAVACLGDLSIWDFSGKGPAGTEPASASEHNNHIEDLAWSPACESIITGGADGRTIIWKTPSRAGQKLLPLAIIGTSVATSRVRWVSEDSILVGREDGSLVKIVIEE